MFNEFVQSLKRLYQDGKISKEKIQKLYQEKKITKNEIDYIITEVG